MLHERMAPEYPQMPLTPQPSESDIQVQTPPSKPGLDNSQRRFYPPLTFELAPDVGQDSYISRVAQPNHLSNHPNVNRESGGLAAPLQEQSISSDQSLLLRSYSDDVPVLHSSMSSSEVLDSLSSTTAIVNNITGPIHLEHQHSAVSTNNIESKTQLTTCFSSTNEAHCYPVDDSIAEDHQVNQPSPLKLSSSIDSSVVTGVPSTVLEGEKGQVKPHKRIEPSFETDDEFSLLIAATANAILAANSITLMQQQQENASNAASIGLPGAPLTQDSASSVGSLSDIGVLSRLASLKLNSLSSLIQDQTNNLFRSNTTIAPSSHYEKSPTTVGNCTAGQLSNISDSFAPQSDASPSVPEGQHQSSDLWKTLSVIHASEPVVSNTVIQSISQAHDHLRPNKGEGRNHCTKIFPGLVRDEKWAFTSNRDSSGESSHTTYPDPAIGTLEEKIRLLNGLDASGGSGSFNYVDQRNTCTIYPRLNQVHRPPSKKECPGILQPTTSLQRPALSEAEFEHRYRTQPGAFLFTSGVGGRHFSPPIVLAHPEEFRNPSSFLKVYGDPLCGVEGKINDYGSNIVKGRNGNWVCVKCQNVNYPRRFRCNKCCEIRDPIGDGVVSEYALHVYQHHLKTYKKLGGSTSGMPTPLLPPSTVEASTRLGQFHDAANIGTMATPSFLQGPSLAGKVAPTFSSISNLNPRTSTQRRLPKLSSPGSCHFVQDENQWLNREGTFSCKSFPTNEDRDFYHPSSDGYQPWRNLHSTGCLPSQSSIDRVRHLNNQADFGGNNNDSVPLHSETPEEYKNHYLLNESKVPQRQQRFGHVRNELAKTHRYSQSSSRNAGKETRVIGPIVFDPEEQLETPPPVIKSTSRCLQDLQEYPMTFMDLSDGTPEKRSLPNSNSPLYHSHSSNSRLYSKDRINSTGDGVLHLNNHNFNWRLGSPPYDDQFSMTTSLSPQRSFSTRLKSNVVLKFPTLEKQMIAVLPSARHCTSQQYQGQS